jgi:hypothetical protein
MPLKVRSVGYILHCFNCFCFVGAWCFIRCYVWKNKFCVCVCVCVLLLILEAPVSILTVSVRHFNLFEFSSLNNIMWRDAKMWDPMRPIVSQQLAIPRQRIVKTMRDNQRPLWTRDKLVSVELIHGTIYVKSHLCKDSQTFLDYLVNVKFEQMSHTVIHRKICKCRNLRHLALVRLSNSCGGRMSRYR